jgi:hypothetical protein
MQWINSECKSSITVTCIICQVTPCPMDFVVGEKMVISDATPHDFGRMDLIFCKFKLTISKNQVIFCTI